MPHLTIDAILQANDLEIRRVSCPEWGGDVYVRTISGDARDAFELRYQGNGDRVGMRATFVGITMCDEHGNFLAPSEAEIKALGRKASGPLDRCFDIAMQVNKMRRVDVEEIEKNSDRTVAPDSG